MLKSKEELEKLRSSLIYYFDVQKQWEVSKLLKASNPSLEQIGCDERGEIYAFIFELEIRDYIQCRPLIDNYEKKIGEVIGLFIRNAYRERIEVIQIVPVYRQSVDWNKLAGIASKKDVLTLVEHLQDIMTTVATGKLKIQDADAEYKKEYLRLDEWLDKLGMSNPNPYKGLWDWYKGWKQNNLQTYLSRRTFIGEMYQTLLDTISRSAEESALLVYTPTGWDRVDRAVYEIKQRLATARNEEQFQAIGMIGRETIITIAQQVYNRQIHKTEDGVDPSETDAKRMLDAFLIGELQGASNERTRKFAKSAVDMANHLTHDRTATKRDAEMCLISVTAVASLMKTISGN